MASSLKPPTLEHYVAAIEADDAYSDAIRAAGGASRWSMPPRVAADPKVQAAYARKVQADNVWLAALRLLGRA